MLLAGVLATLLLLDLLFPIPDPQHAGEGFTQVVTDRNNQVLRAFPDQNGVWRYPVTPSQVSPDYLSALLSYEDRWFYYHPGVNPVSLARAAIQNIRCDCIVSGGSTITMQVARRLSPHSRSIRGKFQQILRALQLEWHYSKEEILTLYLNYAPMGGVIEGVAAASQMYLDKSPAELTLAESALLAVLPQAPSRLRPDRHPERARAARDKVLQRLFLQGKITKEQRQYAKLENIVALPPSTPQLAPLLSRQLISRYSDEPVIQTTLDGELQRELQALLAEEIQRFPEHQSAAILLIDNQERSVKAYLGSADFTDESRFAHVDMIRATRSPGSTLKPFIYGLAIDQGLIHSASLLRDVPRHLRSYQPDNFAQSFTGPVDATTALRQSLNLPAVQVLEALGPASFSASLENAGTSYLIPGDGKPSLALALGGGGFSAWKLATLYSGLANGGEVHPLRLINSHAPELDATLHEKRWLLSPEASWVTLNMLRQPRPNRIRSSALMTRHPQMAWKTGTSYGYRDAWAVGVTPEYTMVVWFGRPDGTPSPGQYGAVTALPLLFRLQQRLDPLSEWPQQPANVSTESICWPTGKAASATPADHCHVAHTAFLVREQIPPTLRDIDSDGTAPGTLSIRLDDTGKMISTHCSHREPPVQTRTLALWPGNLEPWIAPHLRRSEQLPESRPDCEPPTLVTEPLRILGIEEGQTLMPASFKKTQELLLNTLGGMGDKTLYLNGVYHSDADDSGLFRIELTEPGQQEIVVIDSQGTLARVLFSFELKPVQASAH
ncbi:MAG: penicillin-binding protein 1C [Thalassolituus sp.]|nr:MAG: penicillin-binding protein 1C [Thalassolituus sp.]